MNHFMRCLPHAFVRRHKSLLDICFRSKQILTVPVKFNSVGSIISHSTPASDTMKSDKLNVVRRRPRTRSMSELDIQNDSEVKDPQEIADTGGDLSNFSISKKILKKLAENGIEKLFPTQALTYEKVLSGCDMIVQARTGTGKTLAFVLPLLQKLNGYDEEAFQIGKRSPLILTLAPTRELAVQIGSEFEKYQPKNVNVACFYGGAPYESQESALRRGIDILVGTPGRILDHLNKGALKLSSLKHVVLDEADRMMDMGFQESLDEILSHAYTESNKPQTLLFSATIPPWVEKTSKKYMGKDVRIVDLIGSAVNKASVSVEHKAIKCPYHERAATIRDVLQVYSGKHGRSIIFASTKKEANELSLSSVINMETQVLHGDIQQQQREITLKSFRDGKFSCLIATDVAARGLDIPEVDLVIQTEPPKDVDSYIHRAGRTGRAGRNGTCIIFYKPGQEHVIRAVERQAGISFTLIGSPQPADILKASADDAIRSLNSVKESVSKAFLPHAKQVIAERGAEDAVAAALALISGNSEIASRSLLSGLTGFTAYLMKQNLELRSTGLVWSTLRRHFDEGITNAIRGMRMCKDKLGCVFDIPTELVPKVEESWQGDRFATLEILTELPELVDVQQPRNGWQDSNGFGDNRSNGWNKSRGFSRGANQSENFVAGFKRTYNNKPGFVDTNKSGIVAKKRKL